MENNTIKNKLLKNIFREKWKNYWAVADMC